MEYTEKEQVERIKRPIIRRLESIGDKETMITLLKNLSLTKIKAFLDREWQAYADQCDIGSQKELDEKEKTLALKAEKDTW